MKQSTLSTLMPTYAIGDIQGCYSSLQRLLDHIHFEPGRDRLWFVGDLVNKGPSSVEVLRYVRSLGDAAVAVLGNHDLHALALVNGLTRSRRDDSLHDLMASPDRDELMDWLRQRPMLHQAGRAILVHAGLLPFWNAAEARARAQEVEQILRSSDYRTLLSALYEDGVRTYQWSESLCGLPRLCVITNAMTRLRVCTVDGRMEFTYKGPPDQIPAGLLPWFEVPDRRSADSLIICGHWSAMGLTLRENIAALDSGCVFGRQLSALRLEDHRVFQVPCSRRRDI